MVDNRMAHRSATGIDTKQHAHELLDQLGPGQLAAVVQLLEVMIQEEDELTEEDRRTIRSSREYFRENPEAGLSLEEIAASCGLSMEQIRDQTG